MCHSPDLVAKVKVQLTAAKQVVNAAIIENGGVIQEHALALKNDARPDQTQ